MPANIHSNLSQNVLNILGKKKKAPHFNGHSLPCSHLQGGLHDYIYSNSSLFYSFPLLVFSPFIIFTTTTTTVNLSSVAIPHLSLRIIRAKTFCICLLLLSLVPRRLQTQELFVKLRNE